MKKSIEPITIGGVFIGHRIFYKNDNSDRYEIVSSLWVGRRVKNTFSTHNVIKATSNIYNFERSTYFIL